MTETNLSHRQSERELMNVLAKLGGARTADDELVFEGKKFIIPATMTLRSAVKFLQQKIAQDEEETSFERTFKFRPWDGAHALQSALKKNTGTSGIGKATYTMFGKNPPKVITIDVSPNEQAQVPWGRIEFPMLEAIFDLGGVVDKEYGPLFHLRATMPRKYRAHIEGLFKLIEEELRECSIYKGKAFTGGDEPQFVDPTTVDRKKVVYSEEVFTQLRANVWSLMRHTQATREAGLPLKRSVLLGGPYGTGKSLAAMLTAQEALANGWTFILCRPDKDDLQAVMQTARLYQPAVVFYEDVDKIASEGDPESISKLLDIFDGITAKNTELLVVMTTNHVDKIHKGMLRPGRLDSIIMIEALDKEGFQRLIKAQVREDQLDPKIDFNAVGDAMEGFLPAFVTEAIQRAVRYSIDRTGTNTALLTTHDFVEAANGLRPQLALMDGASEGNRKVTMDDIMVERIEGVVQRSQLVESGDPDSVPFFLRVAEPDDEAQAAAQRA